MNSFPLIVFLLSCFIVSVTSFQNARTLQLSGVKKISLMNKLTLAAKVTKGKEEPDNDYWQGDWVCLISSCHT